MFKNVDKNKSVNINDYSDYGVLNNLSNPFGYNFGKNYKVSNNYQKVHHKRNIQDIKK